MGIEIEVNSLDEMCDLMCYNKLPKRRKRMVEMGKYVSATVNGCDIERPKHKRDCYFFHEDIDMGALIPCCTFGNHGYGDCPCDNCLHYITKSKASQIVRDYIKGEIK